MAGRLRGRLEQRGCDVASGDDQWTHARRLAVASAPVARPSRRYPRSVARSSSMLTTRPTAVPRRRRGRRDDASWRCRRDGAPLWLTSSVPSPTLLNDGAYRSWGDVAGRGRRLSSSTDARAIRTTGCSRASPSTPRTAHSRVAIRSRSSSSCNVSATDGSSRAPSVASSRAVASAGRRRRSGRPTGVSGATRAAANFCRACGATNLKRLRTGVTTLARDVAAQLGQEVSEVRRP